MAACHAARAPRQARGQRRIDEILDAAESLIGEVGVADASVQEIARRAGASVGSMYHFFPTKDAIIAALAERHARLLQGVCGRIARQADDRAAQPLGAFVDGIVSPFVEFIAGSPAYLVLAREDGIGDSRVSHVGDTALGTEFRHTLEAALARRFGAARSAEWAFPAAVVQAMGEGVLSRAARAGGGEREQYFSEFRRVLEAYLGTFEMPDTPGAGVSPDACLLNTSVVQALS